MTTDVGGSTIEIELNKLSNMTADVTTISKTEYQARISKAQQLMREQDIDALYLNAETNLYYVTGLNWYKSERMVGAILPAQGELEFIAPYFEECSLREKMLIQGSYKLGIKMKIHTNYSPEF